MGKNEVLKRKYGFLNPMIRTGSLVVGLKGVRCGEGWELLGFVRTQLLANIAVSYVYKLPK